jgi:aspartate kinase
MALVVQKFGGTSLADATRIKRVAERVVGVHRGGSQVVVVVSAMGQATDDLMTLATEVSTRAHPREMDMLLTAGERVSMALVAMAIEDLDVPAVSFTGSQAGILTTGEHGEAQIVDVTPFRVSEALDQGKIVIVAGFQGVSPDSRDVTTLGRGGSDTTAVALAAALEADRCEIYTDVDGVFTADPRIVPGARKIDELGFDDMYDYAVAGAGVLMAGSVDYGRRHGVPIHVRSSFHDEPGTWIKADIDHVGIVGIAHRDGIVTVVGAVPAATVTAILDDVGIQPGPIEKAPMSVTVPIPTGDVDKAVIALHDALMGEAA